MPPTDATATASPERFDAAGSASLLSAALAGRVPDRRLLGLFDEHFWRSNGLVPLADTSRGFEVATDRSIDPENIRLLRRRLGGDVLPRTIASVDVELLFDMAYRPNDAVGAFWWPLACMLDDFGLSGGREALDAGSDGRGAHGEDTQDSTLGRLDRRLSVASAVVQLAVGEPEALEVLALRAGLPQVHLEQYRVAPSTLRLVPGTLARQLRATPIVRNQRTLVCAFDAIPPASAIDALAEGTGLTIRPALCTPSALDAALDAVQSGDEVPLLGAADAAAERRTPPRSPLRTPRPGARRRSRRR